MKAIITKYLPPTNHKPARIKAYDQDGNSITISKLTNEGYPDHAYAVRQLCDKMKWKGVLNSGTISNTQMVWVFVEGYDQITVGY